MRNHLYGLTLVAILTLIAYVVGQTQFAIQINLSTLTLAILFGMLIGNTFYPKLAVSAQAGVQFAKGTLLRLGIILYGFRLTLQDIHQVGLNGIAADAIMLMSTFTITCWIGIRYFKIDKQIVYLTAAGCSICGAAAVMATEPVVKAQSHKVSVAIALVVIFGTICMFLYPQLYHLFTALSAHQFGIYIGSSVHEVAQVYAAGSNINPEVANQAVITKMIRVMMLAPFLLVLSWFLQRNAQHQASKKIQIPWFALGFIAVALFNSLNLLPSILHDGLIQLDTLLLMAAMSALGLTTQVTAIKQAGAKPLLLGAVVCLWLILGGFSINWLIQFCLG